MTQANIKKQLETIITRVKDAEKNAEKTIKTALKSTEKFRETQLKNVQGLIKQARTLKKGDVAAKAEQVRKDIERGASQGLELLMSKLNLPTRAEIDRLNKRITSLQKRLDEVEAQSSASPKSE